MKETWKTILPLVLVLVFAVTRWPGLMPPNFSAAYGLAFCAGVYLPARIAWLVPLGVLVATDLLLNLHYSSGHDISAFNLNQLLNYAVFAGMIWLGRSIGSRASAFTLVGGGLLCALSFYFITNTAAWFFNPFGNPEYTRTLTGWIIALTKGTAGYPETWQFFRNTLLSGGLFTALFVAVMKTSDRAEAPEETAAAGEPEMEPSSPDESKA